MIFSPSIDIIFNRTTLPLSEKIKKVHDLGFSAFEFWDWEHRNLEEVRKVTMELGIQVASMCAKPISLVDPARRQEFLLGLESSLKAAQFLECPYLIVLTGDERIGVSREEQIQSVVKGLQESISLLEGTGVTLVLEPLNVLFDHKGYLLSTSAEAFHIIDCVADERIKVLFDVYHQQITEGNLISNITKYFDRIGYFHIADHPGRHEPGTGEINYASVLDAVRKLGYVGYIGLEYEPTADAEESLKQFIKSFH